MNKQSKKVELCVIQHAALENNSSYLLRTEITRSHLSNRICQHCGVKTSTVTPSFYYVFNVSLSCINIDIPSFIGNLWWVLLLGNHLKVPIVSVMLLWFCCVVFVFLQCFKKVPYVLSLIYQLADSTFN